MADPRGNVVDLLARRPGLVAILAKDGGWSLEIYGRLSMGEYEQHFTDSRQALVRAVGLAAHFGLAVLFEPEHVS